MRKSPLAWFRNKTVAVWGCGAIGGHVAESLARAGVAKIILWDKGIVTPGVLVRQPFEDSDIGKNKAIATRERLLRIIPGLSVEAIEKDILDNPPDHYNWAGGVDMVINRHRLMAGRSTLRSTQDVGSCEGNGDRFNGVGSSCPSCLVICG